MGVNMYFAYGFIQDLPRQSKLVVSCYVCLYLCICLRIVSADLRALAAWVVHIGRDSSGYATPPLKEKLLWPSTVPQ